MNFTPCSLGELYVNFFAAWDELYAAGSEPYAAPDEVHTTWDELYAAWDEKYTENFSQAQGTRSMC